MSFGTDDFNRKLQQFLNDHMNDFSSADEAIAHFTKQYNNGNILEDSSDPKIQSSDFFDKAAQADNELEAYNFINKALKLWPENWDAHLFKITLDNEDNEAFYFIKDLKELEEKAKKDWKNNTDRSGWLNIDERPYLRVKNMLANMQFESGLLKPSLKHFLEMYRLDKMDPLGSRYKIMQIYTKLNDWESGSKFFAKAPNANEDDEMMLPLVILAVLTGNDKRAKQLFKQLMGINPELFLILHGISFPFEDILEAPEVLSEGYQPNSYDSLILSLSDLKSVIIDNLYLFEWLSLQVNEEDFTLFEESNSILAQRHLTNQTDYPSDFMNTLENINYSFDPIFFDIDISRKFLLIENGFETINDFADTSEKEILKIKGIGAATIRQLKENGVKFKRR